MHRAMNKRRATILVYLFLGLVEHQSCTNGAVTLSPSPRARVCYVGERVEVTCNSTSSILKWLIFYLEDGSTTQLLPVPLISSTTLNEIIRVVNTSTLAFFRISERRLEIPVASMLVIDTVSKSLNGTSITCMDGNPAAMATTTVHIAGNINGRPNSELEVNVIIEEFEAVGVFVTLQWTRTNSFISHNVSAVPWTSIVINNTKATLTLTYNTSYNVSIVELCGHHNFTTIVEINYKSCEEPLQTDRLIIVMGYDTPATIGSNVTFSCPPGMVLNGPNTSTCMENGKWEPNPQMVECISEIISCAQPSDKRTIDEIAVALVTVFVVTSVLFFITGFLCGRYCQKERKASETASQPNNRSEAPYYEDILPKENEQKLELKENVAYGPL